MKGFRIKTTKLWAISLAVTLVLLVRIPTASAILLVSIDMDPTAVGIQSDLTVVQGNTFGIDLVLTSDGTPIDTAIFQVDFNDTGSVLGMTGGPTAGSFAAMGAFIIDAFNLAPVPVIAGFTTLTTSPSAPTPPYVSTSGSAGLVSLLGPIFLPPLSVTDIFGLNFDALALGTSTLTASDSFGLGGLAGFGQALLFDAVGGTVTVVAASSGPLPIPEPASLLLLGLGLFGVAMSKSKKTRH